MAMAASNLSWGGAWRVLMLCWGGACLCDARAAMMAATAPEFLVRNWQMEDGLPDNSVRAIVQTRDGYLWVGTDNGLARFDGVQFKAFDSQNTPELKSSRILSLLEDRDGGLWIGASQGGLARLYQGQFQRIDFGGQAANDIPALLEDAEGTVWAAAGGQGFVRFRVKKLGARDNTDGAWKTGLSGVEFNIPSETTVFGQRAVTKDAAGRIWASSTTNLCVSHDGHWQTVLAQQGITAIGAKRGGGLWIAGNNGFLELAENGISRELGPYPWDKGSLPAKVTVLHEDRAGRLWAGTEGNGVLRRSENGAWSYVAVEGPLFQNVITCIVEDREGSIWIGAENGGLHRLKRRTVTVLPLPEAARDSNVHSIWAARDGGMWIGTGGAGVFRFQNGQFTHFAEAQGLTGLGVNAVIEDSHTNLWAATEDGLFVFKSGRFQKDGRFGQMPGWVMTLFEDRQGRLWVGANGGVACQDRDQVRWFTAADGLTNADVRAITEDINGNIWVGSVGGGLHRIKGGRMTHYGKEEGMSSEMVVALLADRDGTLWIGTYKEGLIRMKAGRFTTFTTKDGLRNNIAGHFTDDKEGNLWVSSVCGLMRLSKAGLDAYSPGQGLPLSCLMLTVSDGMFSQLCSGGAQPNMAWDAEGRLWVPNMKAIAIVDPREVAPEALPRVVMEETLVDGWMKPLDPDGALRAPFGKNRFELRYTALNLAAAENMRFRFKLDGWDDDWVDAGVRRAAEYSALPSGHYRFRVMASGRDGVWKEAATPLLLEVVPRFWQTWWFHIGAGAMVIGTVASGVHLVARRKARAELERLERRHAMERERARIARDIHDELGAGLAQIALLADLGGGAQTDRRDVRRSFAAIAQRARSTVASLDEIVWAVNPRNDNLTRLADYLCRQAEECFENSSIRCYKEVPTNLPPTTIHAETRHNLTLAVKEALTNTLRHARASEVWLRLSWADPDLEIVVEDNGCGFNPAAVLDQGNGLGNQRGRLNKIGGVAEVRSELGRGTCTTFRIRLTGGS